ncbi:HNH endonuclease [Campylobacter jejuni]|uniref:Putative HNH nuclease YajD n=1 Tax=Campylobacter jejuni TaxID=197 RepID=A0A5T2A1P9_CAMJU|nr:MULTISPECIES: HNH endonuclease signature motif containing protein [Campylobacter]AMP65638.1 HNH nuclease [Campylobacter jejuni]EAH4556690.1 HNH endonuclease [Campylobacter jejuni]EAH4993524.1 HNH endonuclease [Campylobacter jejuni]EAH5101576.1 HNH endonuclease [Campylobacter jejuni]EAH5284764.1 HNH endonuclease [Campylobacter coli]
MTIYKLCKCGKKIQTHLRTCEECDKTFKKIANKRYDCFKRDKQSSDFYNSVAWRKLRNAFINKNPFCAKCGKFAKIIDHIVPIKQGGEKLSEENLQSLCIVCHNEKTKNELKGWGM